MHLQLVACQIGPTSILLGSLYFVTKDVRLDDRDSSGV